MLIFPNLTPVCMKALGLEIYLRSEKCSLKEVLFFCGYMQDEFIFVRKKQGC